MTKQEWLRFSKALRKESNKCYGDPRHVLGSLADACLVMSTETPEEEFSRIAQEASDSR